MMTGAITIAILTSFCCGLADDPNCDGTVNAADAAYLICFVFKGGPPPCDPDDSWQPDC